MLEKGQVEVAEVTPVIQAAPPTIQVRVAEVVAVVLVSMPCVLNIGMKGQSNIVHVTVSVMYYTCASTCVYRL